MEDKPESGKLYSMLELSKGKSWKESEVATCVACGEVWPCTVYKNRKSYTPPSSVLHSPLKVTDDNEHQA